MLPDGVQYFAGDLPEQEQKVVWATHYPPAADLFDQKMVGTAWKSKPSWYILATQDQTVHPDLQRFVAKRMGASTHALHTTPVAILSHPNSSFHTIPTAANAS